MRLSSCNILNNGFHSIIGDLKILVGTWERRLNNKSSIEVFIRGNIKANKSNNHKDMMMKSKIDTTIYYNLLKVLENKLRCLNPKEHRKIWISSPKIG